MSWSRGGSGPLGPTPGTRACSVGIRLSDEDVRVAVAHRLRCKACEPHKCPCDKAVDARGLWSMVLPIAAVRRGIRDTVSSTTSFGGQ